MGNSEKQTLYIDFGPYAQIQSVKKIYSVLKRQKRTKTKYITNAFKVYKEQEELPQQITELINNICQLKYITQVYGIEPDNIDKIREILSATDFSEVKVFNTDCQPKKMLLSFDTSDPDAKELFDTLSPMKTREKVFSVTSYIQAYLDAGKDIEYLAAQSEELLRSLAALYESKKDDKTLREIARIISVPFNTKYLPYYANFNFLQNPRDDAIKTLTSRFDSSKG